MLYPRFPYIFLSGNILKVPYTISEISIGKSTLSRTPQGASAQQPCDYGSVWLFGKAELRIRMRGGAYGDVSNDRGAK